MNLFPLGNKLALSAIILTKNEESNIIDCIESINFADEIVIIDDYSEDRTLELVENLKSPEIKIFKRLLGGDFAKQRNFGLSKATGQWVFFLDADERVTKELKNEISHLITDHDRGVKLNGYLIRRRDIIWKKELEYGETGNIKLLRLARKDKGEWEGKVHEQWKIKGRVVELDNPLLHHPHQAIREFLQEINFYSSICAQELYSKGEKAYWWSIILYPKAKLFLNYFLRMGFRDGIQGFIFAIMMSFHSFLVRAKLWQLWRKS